YRIVVTGGGEGVAAAEGGSMEATYAQAEGFRIEHPARGPRVVLTSPSDAARGVPPGAHPRVSFSKSVDPLTIDPRTIVLLRPDGSVVEQAAGSPALEASGRAATLVPAQALVTGTVYRIQVRGGPSGVKDLAGNPMEGTYTMPLGFEADAAE